LIQMFLDGGCDSGFQYSSPHRKEDLIWSVSIHRGLDLYLRGWYPLVLFLIFIPPVWADFHFMDKLVRFMSPSFFYVFFFPYFNNIFMSIWQKIRVEDQFSWEPLFLCHLFLPYQKKKKTLKNEKGWFQICNSTYAKIMWVVI